MKQLKAATKDLPHGPSFRPSTHGQDSASSTARSSSCTIKPCHVFKTIVGIQGTKECMHQCAQIYNNSRRFIPPHLLRVATPLSPLQVSTASTSARQVFQRRNISKEERSEHLWQGRPSLAAQSTFLQAMLSQFGQTVQAPGHAGRAPSFVAVLPPQDSQQARSALPL